MSAPIKTPLTYGDAVQLAKNAAANYPSVVSALLAVDQASRDQQRQECAGHVSPFELREFLEEVSAYLDRHLDVDEPQPGRKVTDEAGHLHRAAEALLAKVEEALASEQPAPTATVEALRGMVAGGPHNFVLDKLDPEWFLSTRSRCALCFKAEHEPAPAHGEKAPAEQGRD